MSRPGAAVPSVPAIFSTACGSANSTDNKTTSTATNTTPAKADAAKAVDALFNAVTDALKKGDEVRLVGFGTFAVKERAAGTGRNPATGAEIKIAASKSARFKPGATLKTELNK